MSAPHRAAIVATAAGTIRAGSKSFHLASRLFDKPTRERAWLLYCWCRHCDDSCDGQSLGRPAATPASDVSAVVAATERVLAGEPVEGLAFQALAIVLQECSLLPRLIRDHLRGFELDAAGFRPETEEDLLVYCYHVAGTVGCMMAIVMGVDPQDDETLTRASHLGLAFQLANIARDIRDDHEANRCYLPAEWMRIEGLDARNPLRSDQRTALVAIVKRLADLSGQYRRSALTGVPKLPFRARWAVLTAARTYGAIGERVAELGAEAWVNRVFLRRREKLGHLVASLLPSVRMRGAT